ncbi:MAG: DUF3299 domain-containing protein [Pseudomonadota bacterium]
MKAQLWFLVLFGLIVSACGESGTFRPGSASVSERVAEAPMTISWDDLLPEGEEERIIKAYDDFYAALEEQYMSAQPRMLSDLGGMDGMGGIAEGSALDTMPQLGTFNTVDSLDEQRIELPGFIVPLDVVDGALASFLVVPYFGACIHTPPPPPNQVVYGIADPAIAIEDTFYPYWFEGVMRTGRQDTDLGNAAYTLNVVDVRPYE